MCADSDVNKPLKLWTKRCCRLLLASGANNISSSHFSELLTRGHKKIAYVFIFLQRKISKTFMDLRLENQAFDLVMSRDACSTMCIFY